MKRYSFEELEPMLEEIIYEHLAISNKMYYADTVEAEGKSVPELIFADRNERAEACKFRINDYSQRRDNTKDQYEKDVYSEAVRVLTKELDRISNINIKKQKELYKETGDVASSHTHVCVPLNKKLGACYNDFYISCCFFDSLTSEQGVKEFKALKTKAEKIKYVKEHIEITHIVLVSNTIASKGITIKGKFKEECCNISSPDVEFLPKKYADFKNITLDECEDIANKELRQLIKKRVDKKRNLCYNK